MSDAIEVKEPICQLKIVSDGTSVGTQILMRDGTPAPFYATKITWTCAAEDLGSGIGTAVIEVDFCRMEVTGEVLRIK